jgi:uridine kinase
MTQNPRPVTIGVAGGTGSGKTTISTALLSRIGEHNIAYLPHDTYYKDIDQIPLHEGRIRNFDHPDSLDTHLMVENIKELQQWKPTEVPVYNFRDHRRQPYTRTIGPQPIILIEGILIFAEPDLRDLFDVKIFVDTDADVRFIRRLKRDITERGRTVDSVIEQYLKTVRPMHLQLVEPSKRYADIIIPEGGFNTVAIDMLADRIRNMLPTPPSMGH